MVQTVRPGEMKPVLAAQPPVDAGCCRPPVAPASERAPASKPAAPATTSSKPLPAAHCGGQDELRGSTVSAYSHYFTSTDYPLSLPMMLLALFGLGVLLIDLMLPAEWKRLNAVTALLGIGFSAVALCMRIQLGHIADGARWSAARLPFTRGFVRHRC